MSMSYFERLIEKSQRDIDFSMSVYVKESAERLVKRIESIAIPFSLIDRKRLVTDYHLGKEQSGMRISDPLASGGTYTGIRWHVGLDNVMTIRTDVKGPLEIETEDAVHDVSRFVVEEVVRELRTRPDLRCGFEKEHGAYRILISFPLEAEYIPQRQEGGCIIS